MTRGTTFRRRAALPPLAALLLGASALSQAQSSDIPDLEGIWGWGACMDRQGWECMLLDIDDPRLTERAKGYRDAFDEVAQPKYDCAPMSIPHLWSDPYAYEIEQLDDRVIFRYEKDDVVRTAWLEGKGHEYPHQSQYFTQGFSTARYEGDALVVETTRFTFDPQGLNADFKLASSTQKKVVERYFRDGDAMRLDVETTDAFMLKEPWVFQVRSQPVEGPLPLPWDCDATAARQTLTVLPSSYPQDAPPERLEIKTGKF